LQEEVKDCKIIMAVNKVDLLMESDDENESIFKKRCEFYYEIE